MAASPATKSARTAVSLTRADLNSRDSLGNTILHYAASSTIPLAGAFVAALLEAAWLDLYIQDEESGWTCLHRALYMGNITIARALMERDIQDVDISGAAQHAGGLIKIKDREGNSPFDVYRLTIAPRLLPRRGEHFALAMSAQEDDPDTASSNSGEGDNVARVGDDAIINIDGDDVFTFGSNKNLNLGFGDDEDRQFPERITLKRPPHLLNRLYQEHQKKSSLSDEGQNAVELPAVTKYMGLRIQDVQLSKLHSAILTTDPESNLYICGFGPGGRLGTGDESTRFAFTCISGGGLVEKKVVAVGLGQNHTLAISSGGEVFSWGNNCYGQLGYAAANLSSRDGDPIQLSPRQIFGPLKRELVIGCAASRTHSVVFTSSSLFTFGKHDGQLGVFDSDARALAIQDTPRKVAASLFSSTISMVSAIEKATICLLDNHEVWVFANYGYTKVPFQREVPLTLSRHSLAGFRSNVVRPENLCIIKLASGGDTVCGLAKGGDVFTFTISQKSQPLSTSISTTNPSKIRGALSSPQQVWSLRKDHMAVTDVDVSQDGSIIICTESGSVWRRVRRAKLRDVNITTASNDAKKKDYKFSRVPGLTRVSAVRSNAFGAYAAIRKDFNVLKSQVEVDPKTLWADILSLLPFKELSASTVTLPYGKSPTIVPDLSQIRRTVLSSSNIGEDLDRLFSRLEQSENSAMDIRIGSTTKDIQIPCHEFVISARSPTLRNGFQKFRNSYFFEVTNTLTIEYDKTGRILVLFSSADILTVLNFILYCYSDSIVDFWHETKRQPAKACLYRQVRVELMKIASQLEVRGLERAARLMIEPEKLMHIDFQSAVAFPEFLDTGDIEIELDGASIVVHSALICRRCPFFDGLLNGRAKGSWLSSRREALEESDLVQVDMKHVDPQTFTFVVRYLYADPGEEIFDEVLSKDLDEFLDKVIDVMSVANELMLDRLSQICQKTVAKYGKTRQDSFEHMSL